MLLRGGWGGRCPCWLRGASPSGLGAGRPADPLPGLRGGGLLAGCPHHRPQRGGKGFLFAPRLCPVREGLSGGWGWQRLRRGARSLAAGSWRHRSSPEPPPRAGGRQCRPLRQPASRRHRLQAADLGEPGREVTRWSRGAEGHRAEDAPASGRKRSLLPAAPSVGADLLRSPVWRLDLCPPQRTC